METGSYISNVVIMGKRWSPTEIRMNLDLRDVNYDVEDHRHEVQGSDTFTTLDANNMFFQFKIRKDKRKIITFRTPWGLYRMKRLHMGVTVAPADINS